MNIKIVIENEQHVFPHKEYLDIVYEYVKKHEVTVSGMDNFGIRGMGHTADRVKRLIVPTQEPIPFKLYTYDVELTCSILRNTAVFIFKHIKTLYLK